MAVSLLLGTQRGSGASEWRRRRMAKQQKWPGDGRTFEPVRLPLFSATHERTGDVELSGAVFGRSGDLSLLHEAVRMQLANRRSGTAATKTRGYISGGGRKPWRQKGT